MKLLTKLAHEFLANAVATGDTVIDATAGNGHDTRFLAELVGPSGRVIAFDVQPEAVEKTTAVLTEARLENVELYCRCHTHIGEVTPVSSRGSVAAVTFNLGYLPGSDKTVITKAESSRHAILSATRLIRPGGVVTIVSYTGHRGGAEEAIAVRRTLNELSPADFAVAEHLPEANRANPPVLFTVTRK